MRIDTKYEICELRILTKYESKKMIDNKEKFIRVVQLAMGKLALNIQEKQQRLILQKHFDDKACLHPETYHPGKPALTNDLWGDLEEKMKADIALLIELEKSLDQYREIEWSAIVSEFLRQRK